MLVYYINMLAGYLTTYQYILDGSSLQAFTKAVEKWPHDKTSKGISRSDVSAAHQSIIFL